ncbi:MAG: MBL fold metallo-hydrolase [Chloroflexi bacterium]|nr:MBL fold metallo-hydrolase [Chloroflexota bacterium]MBI3732167.1 MBL fold metallo-hydrolase [Chloroflexota bacterium]
MLTCPETKESALVDPGDEFDQIVALVGRTRVKRILLTHTDLDHIGALEQARDTFRANVYVHAKELTRPSHAEAPRKPILSAQPLSDGQSIRIGRHSLTVYETPGHTPGHVVFRFDRRAIVGDAIFPGGPGRTHSPADLETGLYHLQRVVFRWDDRITLYPGHGQPTTVGAQRDNFMRFLAKPRADDLYGDVSWA